MASAREAGECALFSRSRDVSSLSVASKPQARAADEICIFSWTNEIVRWNAERVVEASVGVVGGSLAGCLKRGWAGELMDSAGE